VTESDAAAPGADVVPGFGDIGARLRAARERAGFSVAQVAEKMHCDRGLVEALDAGRFAQLGAPVFARGHIRRYAELLGEPVGEILEHWDREAAGHVSAPDLTRIPKARRTPDTRRFLLPVGVAVVVAAFAVLISWVLRDAPLPALGGLDAPAVANLPVAQPTGTPVGDAPPAGDAPPVGEAAPLLEVAPVDEGAAVVAATPAPIEVVGDAVQAAAAPAPTVTPVAAGNGTVALRLRARADCWVEVYDARRRQLYFGMLRGGAAASVAGAGPLRMLLGNVGGITIDVNGRSVSVPRALQRANTANVRVAADGTLSASARD
jgi:cytoskeleton protein RodZ